MAAFTLRVEPPNVVNLLDSVYIDFVKSLGVLCYSMPLTEMKLTTIGPDHYVYQFTTVDGRLWKQDLWVLPDLAHNFHCNFDKIQGDEWSEQEFSSHRDVRRGAVKLVRLGVTKIVATWEPMA